MAVFPCLLCCTNLCVVGRLIFYGKRAVAATKVVGAMAHQQGCQFAINAVRRPVFGNADDPGAVLPQKRPKVFDVDRENDASLLARQLVDCGGREVRRDEGVVVSNRKFCTLSPIFLQNPAFSVR